MDYSQITEELAREYEQRRLKNYALYQQRQREACQKCPGLKELLDRRHMMVVSGIRFGILHQEGGEPLRDTSAQMTELNRQIHGMLENSGLPADILKPIYTCPVCRDEGYFYNPNRVMCECYRKALSDKMLSRYVHPDHSFEKFNPSLYSDEVLFTRNGQKYTPKRMANLTKTYCMAYADHYPNCEQNNILMIGPSGVGKTFLMDCIARRLMERRYLPRYTTAYALFEEMRKAFFANDESHMDQLIGTEILLLDDLGSEPLFNNVTVELLFNLLNGRLRQNRHTIISTNLNQEEIRAKYTERISSRLLDPAETKVIRFYGGDARRREEAAK